MRILFVAFPARAHVNNLVPLAWACAVRGHDVRVACHPDGASVVAAAGLVAVPVGGPEGLADGTGVPGPPPDPEVLDRTSGFDTRGAEHLRSQRDFVVGALAMYLGESASHAAATHDVVELARDWGPGLVVFDQLAFHGAVAARACGVPSARLLFGVDHGADLRRRFLRSPGSGRFDLATVLAAGTSALSGRGIDDALLFGDLTVDPVPAGIGTPPLSGGRVLPMYNIPYTGGAVAEAGGILRTPPRTPRVCLTFGVSGREVWGGEESVDVAAVLDEVAGTGVEVAATLTADQVAELGTLPPSVRALDYLPLTALLSDCSAVVHRGGIGTMAAAVHHRIPQVVVPGAYWDEDLVAAYVHDRGAGTRVPAGDVAADLAKAVMRAVEDPGQRDAADRLRSEQSARPGPLDVADELVARAGAAR